MASRFSVWNFDDRNMQWLEVAQDMPLKQARESLEGKHHAAQRAGIPSEHYVMLPSGKAPRHLPEPAETPAAPAPAPTGIDRDGRGPIGEAAHAAREAPRTPPGITLPEWDSGLTEAGNYQMQADAYTDAAMTALDSGAADALARAQVLATLAQASATTAAGVRVVTEIEGLSRIVDGMSR